MRQLRLSQESHILQTWEYVKNETFTKHELKERRINLSNGNTHCRDSIAAFNLQHLIGDKEYDVSTMKEKYNKFCRMEQEEIKRHQMFDEKISSNFGIN